MTLVQAGFLTAKAGRMEGHMTVAVDPVVLVENPAGGHQSFHARASLGLVASKATQGNGPWSGTTPLAMPTLRFRGGKFTAEPAR